MKCRISGKLFTSYELANYEILHSIKKKTGFSHTFQMCSAKHLRNKRTSLLEVSKKKKRVVQWCIKSTTLHCGIQ